MTKYILTSATVVHPVLLMRFCVHPVFLSSFTWPLLTGSTARITIITSYTRHLFWRLLLLDSFKKKLIRPKETNDGPRVDNKNNVDSSNATDDTEKSKAAVKKIYYCYQKGTKLNRPHPSLYIKYIIIVKQRRYGLLNNLVVL